MLSHVLKTAWRNLSKTKTYSAINIGGLAIGLAGFIIILLYLNYELSYDSWDPRLKKVYKVSLQKGNDILSQTPAPLASFLAQQYRDAAAGTAFQAAGDIDVLIAANGKKIYQKGMVMADSCFLKVFPYKLVQGNAATALNEPNAVILSEELSHILFGNSNPMGKTIKAYNSIEGVVTGVMQEPEGPSHLMVKMIMRDPHERSNKFWENYSYQTYISLKQPVAEEKIAHEINRLFYDVQLKENNTSFEYYKKAGELPALFIDAVPDIHNFPKHGSSYFTTVSILLILAFLLLITGAINFSNLAMAQSIARAKEVGVRKVLGSGYRQLVIQFMSETFFQCVISLGIAVLIVYVALPYYNRSFNITLSLRHLHNPWALVVQIVLCLLFIAVLSGLYPSLLLSRFNATRVLKGDYSTGKKGMLFRNCLIVVQFMVSAFFIIATIVVSSQMRYMQSKDKGFSDAQVMRIQAVQNTREAGFATARNILLSIPGVGSVAKTTAVPGDNSNLLDTSTRMFKCAGRPYRLASVKVSTDYFSTLQVPLVKGRFFTEEYADQHTRTAIINETAAARMNLGDPIGKTITFEYCDSIPVQIVGVVKDLNVQGFEHAVQPVVYTIGNKSCLYQSGGAILVKLNSAHLLQSVAAIEQAWKKIEPDFPLRYSFLDNNFQQLFLSHRRLQMIINFFAVVAILISVMGLFALTTFFAKRRTKEIGIRKVLGASVINLSTILSKEFIFLVLLSVVITTPVAWWAMHQWLQTFVYRIHISWWMFGIAALGVLFIALTTVSMQAIKAALANPVKSLRTE